MNMDGFANIQKKYNFESTLLEFFSKGASTPKKPEEWRNFFQKNKIHYVDVIMQPLSYIHFYYLTIFHNFRALTVVSNEAKGSWNEHTKICIK